MTTPTPDRPTQPPAVPDALLAQWREGAYRTQFCDVRMAERHIAKCAAAWAWSQREDEVQKAKQRGADAELEACCEWLRDQGGCHGIATMLRDARRPAPPTLREQALADLEYLNEHSFGPNAHLRIENIRKALQEGADG